MDTLYPSGVESSLYEIRQIKFTGNTIFPETDLQKVISSKSTERSFPHTAYNLLYRQTKKFHYPKFIVDNLDSGVKKFSSEVHFYNKQQVELDSIRLTNYYFQKGYHFAKVNTKFYGIKRNKSNALEFEIESGPQFFFKDIVYLGLDSLPLDIKHGVDILKKIKSGSPFDEYTFIKEVTQIHRKLIESGYYFSKFEQLPVIIDTVKKNDSITIIFSPGIRQRIGNINFIDSTHGVKRVTDNLKKSQLTFSKGDWYSPLKIASSEMNLYSLGTFDFVKIDTSKIQDTNDSVIDFDVNLNYRKQHDFSIGAFINRTAFDQLINVGVEATYSYKNPFGSAEIFNPFARVQIDDISNSIRNIKNAEWEYSFGFNWTQPEILKIDAMKVGFSAQPFISLRYFNNFLRILSYGLPFKFPFKFPEFTYFPNFSIDFSIERQIPLNFQSAIDSLRKKAITPEDSIRVNETTALYHNLDTFNKAKHPIFTVNTIALSMYGDTRNNPFSPTKGQFTTISAEFPDPIFSFTPLLKGIANYIRLQFSFISFWSLDNNSVFALKARAGHIIWSDKQNSYIPYEKQFFAGGANSVRGWQSRTLRYFNTGNDSLNKANAVNNFITDFVGNGTIIESSVELRYRFSRPEKLWDVIADQIADFGITGFIDVGNAFQWLIIDDKTHDYKFKYNPIDYLKGLAIAAGLGLRYETPVGPIRIDLAFPVYDPMQPLNSQWLSNRDIWSTRQFHIALGHAF